MRSILAITLSALVLSGCVTESSYNGSNKPVVKNKINNAGAARTRIALALQYLKTGNNSQAKYNLDRAAKFAPNLPEVHYALAYYYQQVDENERADKAYQKALDINPNDPNTLNNYGTFLCGIGEYDRATNQFLKAIEIPTYIRVAESYENLALCAIEFDDFKSAEKYFKQALNHSSQRTSTLISLAALYYAKTDLYKANEMLKSYESTGRVSARALMLSYLIKNRMGRVEEAQKIASTILQTYPSSNEANALREQKTRLNEFEILRKRYRKAQLDELREEAQSGHISEKPKIKIIRKKAPLNDGSISLVTKKKHSASVAESNKATKNRVTNSVVAKNDALLVSATTKIKKENTDPIIQEKKSAVTITKRNITPVQKKAAIVDEAPVPSHKNDTASVLLALSSESNAPSDATPKTVNPVVAKTYTAKTPSVGTEEVKIISFGAPKKANFNAPPTVSKKVEAPNLSSQNNESQVVFYQPTKNAAIFNNAAQSDRDIAFKRYTTSKQAQLPMLNPDVPAIQVPFHIVGLGENLFSISVRYNVKLQKLLQWNGLKESDRVINGRKIYLNDPNIYYNIKSGDSLYDIATQKHVLIDQLMRWNKLSPGTELKPGHRLLLVDPDSYTL